jgi:ketosteroid isomerase-like protein
MSDGHRAIARRFLNGITTGELPDELFTDDFDVWVTVAESVSAPAYLESARALHTLFTDGPNFTIDAFTAEDDRVVAEVRGEGDLISGDSFEMRYAFIFRIRDDRIASLAEHMHPDPSREKIAPLFAAIRAGERDIA